VDDDLVRVVATAEGTEAVCKVGVDGKVLGELKARSQLWNAPEAWETEDAQLGSIKVMTDEIPLVLNAGEMVGLESPKADLVCPEVLILEGEFLAPEEALGSGLEDFGINFAHARWAKGDWELVWLVPHDLELRGDLGADLLKSSIKRRGIGIALVGDQRLPGNEHGHNFLRCEEGRGEVWHFAVDGIGALDAIENDGEAVCAHRRKVALNSLGSYFKISGSGNSGEWNLFEKTFVEVEVAGECRTGSFAHEENGKRN